MTRLLFPSADAEMKAWDLLPTRFHRIDGDRVVVTNLVGEHLVLQRDEFDAVVDNGDPAPATLSAMRARQMIREPGERLPIELLSMKLATRKRRLADLTALHMFVVTLRCEHTCRYCQVSRQSTSQTDFDMTQETAEAALGHVFASPSPNIKIEFQGGESLLNFELIKWIVERAHKINETEQRALTFVIATNLALLDDQVLDFCRMHRIPLSTSLDGPETLHNSNRRRPGQDSWRRAIDGITTVRERLGPHYVAALMTTTEASLGQPKEIIGAYVEAGLGSIFLRPISPYGFALRSRGGGGYGVERWLDFYKQGLAHIVELNRSGTPFTEVYASIIAKKMLTHDDPGYVDLMSPAGIGIGGIVYNYDGGVYASDEGRMLAETGDQTFLLGTVRDSWRDLISSHKLLNPILDSFTLSVPKCDQCAFEPWCGSDPTYHYSTQGDWVGHKAFSDFCARNTGIFVHLVESMEADKYFRDLMLRWAHQ